MGYVDKLGISKRGKKIVHYKGAEKGKRAKKIKKMLEKGLTRV